MQRERAPPHGRHATCLARRSRLWITRERRLYDTSRGECDTGHRAPGTGHRAHAVADAVRHVSSQHFINKSASNGSPIRQEKQMGTAASTSHMSQMGAARHSVDAAAASATRRGETHTTTTNQPPKKRRAEGDGYATHGPWSGEQSNSYIGEKANELRRRTWWSLVETLDGANRNRTDETLIPLTSDDARAPTETLSSASRSGSPSNGHKRWNNTGPPEADIM